MGRVLSLQDYPELTAGRTIQVTVHGTQPVSCVEIVRNNVDVYRYTPDALDVALTWTDREALDAVNLQPAPHQPAPFTFYYIRVTQADGQMAWSSPIWVE